jgi:hypothetical protein
LFSCSKDSKNEQVRSGTNTLFAEITPTNSNISFANNVKDSHQFNFLVYPYIYNGGGVAVGDLNNDGLDDIYFTSNQHSNALYLNKGNLKFEDITTKSGTADSDGWSTGVSMIDINNDGWLDIYICKSASTDNSELRRNKLFINQKNNTFVESAKVFGLDHTGYSTQAYWFDYDLDGDLDMYLANHRSDFLNSGRISSQIQRDIQEDMTDHLFRNDQSVFTKVSAEAGILNKAWSLSASVGDFNDDNWPDIYIANDYLEPDILYINNKNGTFRNEVLQKMKHISFNSMGSDYADINNDSKPDLLVLDMLAEDHARGKENMATMSTANFNAMVGIGYHRQYMANVLQINNGSESFSDIGQLAGITKTDWSWAPLIADFDNDGFKDVFVTNGIENDLGNQDFRRSVREINSQGKAISLDTLLNMIPGDKLPNYIFKNNGDLTFSEKIDEWGFGKKVNSNGVAYSDLDNDGDLDLVINNLNDIASVYQNNQSTNNYLKIKLNGTSSNSQGVGANVQIKLKNSIQYQDLYVNRGFQSSVSNILNFGLGQEEQVEQIKVTWPDNYESIINNVKANQQLTINRNQAVKSNLGNNIDSKVSYFANVNNLNLDLDYKHTENPFNDFSRQLLLPHKQSTLGPCLAVADVNGDTLDDIFIGGAQQQEAHLYLQNGSGKFVKHDVSSFVLDKNYEDTDAIFVDIDKDNDLDLYVTSGGYELDETSILLQDRLYINDGAGNFDKSTALPKMLSNTKVVKAIDIDNDSDFDLIVGAHVVPGKYPLPHQSFILENENGVFKDVTNEIAPDIQGIGVINDIEITDFNNDGDNDILVVGPWMPLTFFSKINDEYKKQDIPEFTKTEGWYYSISSTDMDKDGDVDYLIGNIGMNNKFHPSLDKPLHIFSGYFDENESYDIALSKEYKGQLVPIRGKECSSEQTPFLNEKIETYSEFASLNIEGVYGSETIENSHHLTAYNFKSLYIENNGNGTFNIKPLPIEAQIGPTQDFEILDFNNDGSPDIIGVGNLYDSEVETVRYDASRGYALVGDGLGGFDAIENSGFYSDQDMRVVSKVEINGKTHLILANNNDNLSIFKLTD